MTKALRKAIMKRSRLKNIYLKRPHEENRLKFKRQQNFCTNLLRKTKQKYFYNLNMKDLSLIARLLLIHLITILLTLQTP